MRPHYLPTIRQQLEACNIWTAEDPNKPILAILLRQLPIGEVFSTKQLSEMTGYSSERVSNQLHMDARRYGTFVQVRKGRPAQWKRVK